LCVEHQTSQINHTLRDQALQRPTGSAKTCQFCKVEFSFATTRKEQRKGDLHGFIIEVSFSTVGGVDETLKQVGTVKGIEKGFGRWRLQHREGRENGDLDEMNEVFYTSFSDRDEDQSKEK
jgi:hypothetical protein